MFKSFVPDFVHNIFYNMDAKSAIAFSLLMFSTYVIGAVFGAILLLFKGKPVRDASMKDLL